MDKNPRRAPETTPLDEYLDTLSKWRQAGVWLAQQCHDVEAHDLIAAIAFRLRKECPIRGDL